MAFSVDEIVRWGCETGCCAAEMSERVDGQVVNGLSGIGDDGQVSCTACELGAEGIVSM